MAVPLGSEARREVVQHVAALLAARGHHAQHGVPIVTAKKTTNLVQDPSSTAYFLLETRLCAVDSRNRIRERLSRTEDAGNRAVSPESLKGFSITIVCENPGGSDLGGDRRARRVPQRRGT